MTSRAVICPQCQVPFIRHGAAAQSSGFYRTNEDICICCRENLDPVTLQPTSAEARAKS